MNRDPYAEHKRLADQLWAARLMYARRIEANGPRHPDNPRLRALLDGARAAENAIDQFIWILNHEDYAPVGVDASY